MIPETEMATMKEHVCVGQQRWRTLFSTCGKATNVCADDVGWRGALLPLVR